MGETNASKPDREALEQSRNIGCCTMAAATDGRQHFPICVNGSRGSEWGGGR